MRSLLFCMCLVFVATPAFAQDDPITTFSGTDPVMNAAIAKARTSLPAFWSELSAPKSDETAFTLKIRLTDGEHVEHFWCSNIVGNASHATCEINNDPVQVRTVKLGQRIDVNPDDITDWMYLVGERVKGGETIRVIIRQTVPEGSAQFKEMFID